MKRLLRKYEIQAVYSCVQSNGTLKSARIRAQLLPLRDANDYSFCRFSDPGPLNGVLHWTSHWNHSTKKDGVDVCCRTDSNRKSNYKGTSVLWVLWLIWRQDRLAPVTYTQSTPDSDRELVFVGCDLLEFHSFLSFVTLLHTHYSNEMTMLGELVRKVYNKRRLI